MRILINILTPWYHLQMFKMFKKPNWSDYKFNYILPVTFNINSSILKHVSLMQNHNEDIIVSSYKWIFDKYVWNISNIPMFIGKMWSIC